MNKYLITSRDFYTDNPEIFKTTLQKQLIKHKPSFALYRDKSNPNYTVQAAGFVELCSRFENLKNFIHRDVDLARSLNATGVHLTSIQFDKIEYAKSLGLEVIISTHTHDEVLNAEKLGADYVTYSPIFASPGKGKPKGIDDLKELLKKRKIKVFALGGIIDETQVKVIEQSRAYGFASIRYFYS